MVVYDFSPENLPDDHLRAIGMLVVAGSQTEAIMRDFIGSLLGIEDFDAVALGSQMPFRLKLGVIGTLNELKAPSASELDALDDILDRINAAMDHRNDVAHSAFARHPETDEVIRFKEKSRGGLKADVEPIAAAKLLEGAKELTEVGLALQSFMMSRGFSLRERTEPLREPITRTAKARGQRRATYGEKY